MEFVYNTVAFELRITSGQWTIIMITNWMYTQKKNYILQLKVSRFHDHQAILQSKDQSYLLYCEIGGT